MWRRDDRGQMLLLAGFVLVLAFVVTALTLSQVADLEKRATEDAGGALVSEYRFMHDRVGGTLQGAVGLSTDNDTLRDIFASVVATFKNIEHEKGYDVSIVLAGDDAGVSRDEDFFVDLATGRFKAGTESWDGATDYSNVRYDLVNDGILWTKAGRCSTVANGCVSGVVVRIFLSDGVSTMDESVVYAVNVAP